MAACARRRSCRGPAGREHRPGGRRRPARRRGRRLAAAPERDRRRRPRPLGQVTVGAGATLAALHGGGARGRAKTRRWTSAPATRARSAAWSPATPGAPAPCATAPPAPTWPGSRRCWPTARSISRLDRADQGQRRLRPAGAAGRLGGHAGDHHPGALEARAAADRAGGRAGAAGARSRRRPTCSPRCGPTRPRWRAATSSSTRACSSCSTTSAASRRCATRAPFYVLAECAAALRPDRGAGRRARSRWRCGRRAALIADDTAGRGAPVGAARGSHRGDQRRRDPPQARRRRPAGPAGAVPRAGPGGRRPRPAASG